jgi:methionyl-tRNA formyltransferase
MKLIICGNGHGIKAVYSGLFNSNIKFEVCTTDNEIFKLAKKDKVKCYEKYIDKITSKNDIILTSSYKPKIPKSHIEKAKFYNIHYALLPRYRGMHPIVWSILNGEKYVGYTLHECSILLDEGAIIHQEKIPIKKFSSWELMLQIDKKVSKSIGSIIKKIINNKVRKSLQNEEEAIYVAPRNINDCRIIWNNWDTIFFKRAIQALVEPYPLPFFKHKKKNIEIYDAEVVARDYIEINGRIVYIDDRSIFVKIPNGLLRVYKIRVNGNIKNANTYYKKIGIRFE